MEFRVQPLGRTLHAAQGSVLELAYAVGLFNFPFHARGTLVIALRQPVTIKLDHLRVHIPRYAAFWLDLTYQGTAHAQSRGPWLLMRSDDSAFASMQRRWRDFGYRSLQPIAGLWPDARLLARWALALVRRARNLGGNRLTDSDLAAMAGVLQQAQATFEPQIARCPGRTQTQKTKVFRRLMRVRQYVELNCAANLPVESLAKLASYSRAHFMTVFHAVFGETPHAHRLEQRLHFAAHMLGKEGLSVSQTTLAVGFEDRSSFSKLFRRRFGVTAKSMRQTAHGGCARQSGSIQRQ